MTHERLQKTSVPDFKVIALDITKEWFSLGVVNPSSYPDMEVYGLYLYDANSYHLYDNRFHNEMYFLYNHFSKHFKGELWLRMKPLSSKVFLLDQKFDNEFIIYKDIDNEDIINQTDEDLFFDYTLKRGSEVDEVTLINKIVEAFIDFETLENDLCFQLGSEVKNKIIYEQPKKVETNKEYVFKKLKHAIKFNNKPLIISALNRNLISINDVDSTGKTLYDWSVEYGKVDIMEFLQNFKK